MGYSIVYCCIIFRLDSPAKNNFLFLPKGDEDFSYLPFCFSVGALMAIFKDSLFVSAKEPIGFILLFFLFSKTEYARYFFYLSVFTGIIYIYTKTRFKVNAIRRCILLNIFMGLAHATSSGKYISENECFRKPNIWYYFSINFWIFFVASNRETVDKTWQEIG